MRDLIQLSGNAAELYDSYLKKLEEEETELYLADREFLAVYCLEIATYFESMARVTQAGTVVPFINGKQELERENPYLKIATTALNNAYKAFKEVSLAVKSVLEST